MAKRTKSAHASPNDVAATLRLLGENLNVARRRRKMSRDMMAQRMMVNVKTVDRMEAGDAGISIGILASALWVLGVLTRFTELVPPEGDVIGLQEDLRRLPKIIRNLHAESGEFDF